MASAGTPYHLVPAHFYPWAGHLKKEWHELERENEVEDEKEKQTGRIKKAGTARDYRAGDVSDQLGQSRGPHLHVEI